MRQVFTILYTLKYLKLSQIFYRIYYRLHKPKINNINAIKLRNNIKPWKSPTYQDPTTNDGQNFCFLGQSERLFDDWNSPLFSKLWLYNLHYQNDLNSLGSFERSVLNDSLVDGWINGNPALQGTGWEPYCISLRSVNWIKWFSRKHPSKVSSNWLSSLAVQVSVLEQQLEYHILANHLFANAKALVFAGTYFVGKDGERWLNKGLGLLDEEIREQFLDDGGHYERSPMYHSILLWDIADLINLARLSRLPVLLERVDQWSKIFVKGMFWLQRMVHPDKYVSFFNDSTYGVSPRFDDLSVYAMFLSIDIPLTNSYNLSGCFLSESGYCSIDLCNDSRLIADIGMIGPDYQPGHAHADTLSCELSLFGQRVFVNSGISHYGEGAERNRQRSTAAHNTVEVDGENSSEVWSGFRVARRAYPIDIEYTESKGQISLSAAHTGFRRLKGKVTHHRTWEASPSCLKIVDNLNGYYQQAVGFWHLHPDVKARIVNQSICEVGLLTGHYVSLKIIGATIDLKESTWHPGFGKSERNTVIAFKFESPAVVTEVRWGNN